MRFLLSLAFLSLAASTADARVPKIDKGFMSAVCADEALPFALPSFDAIEDWTDTEYETWLDVRWQEFCIRPASVEARLMCECTGHLAR